MRETLTLIKKVQPIHKKEKLYTHNLKVHGLIECRKHQHNKTCKRPTTRVFIELFFLKGVPLRSLIPKQFKLRKCEQNMCLPCIARFPIN